MLNIENILEIPVSASDKMFPYSMNDECNRYTIRHRIANTKVNAGYAKLLYNDKTGRVTVEEHSPKGIRYIYLFTVLGATNFCIACDILNSYLVTFNVGDQAYYYFYSNFAAQQDIVPLYGMTSCACVLSDDFSNDSELVIIAMNADGIYLYTYNDRFTTNKKIADNDGTYVSITECGLLHNYSAYLEFETI